MPPLEDNVNRGITLPFHLSPGHEINQMPMDKKALPGSLHENLVSTQQSLWSPM
jgi:hypothetical protein